MPMSEQERREYREDLARIFDGIDGVRKDLSAIKAEVSRRVSSETLERKLLEHVSSCKGREPTSAVPVQPVTASGPSPFAWSPMFKTSLWIAAMLGAAIAGFVASGGAP